MFVDDFGESFFPTSSRLHSASYRHAETEMIAVRVRHGEFAQSPGLIDWSGMNGRLRALGGVEASRAKCPVTLVHVFHKHPVDGTENAISGMAGELQFRAVANEINDAIGHLAVFVAGPLALEIKNFGVEA